MENTKVRKTRKSKGVCEKVLLQQAQEVELINDLCDDSGNVPESFYDKIESYYDEKMINIVKNKITILDNMMYDLRGKIIELENMMHDLSDTMIELENNVKMHSNSIELVAENSSNWKDVKLEFNDSETMQLIIEAQEFPSLVDVIKTKRGRPKKDKQLHPTFDI